MPVLWSDLTTTALFVFNFTTIVFYDLISIGAGNHTVCARRGFRIILGFLVTDCIVLVRKINL
jgi:hypothetical protein